MGLDEILPVTARTGFDEQVLFIQTRLDPNLTAATFKTLSSEKRLAILNFLGDQSSSVNEIAEGLGLPFATAAQPILILEKAGWITTRFLPSKRGIKKVCTRVVDRVVVGFNRHPQRGKFSLNKEEPQEENHHPTK